MKFTRQSMTDEEVEARYHSEEYKQICKVILALVGIRSFRHTWTLNCLAMVDPDERTLTTIDDRPVALYNRTGVFTWPVPTAQTHELDRP